MSIPLVLVRAGAGSRPLEDCGSRCPCLHADRLQAAEGLRDEKHSVIFAETTTHLVLEKHRLPRIDLLPVCTRKLYLWLGLSRARHRRLSLWPPHPHLRAPAASHTSSLPLASCRRCPAPSAFAAGKPLVERRVHWGHLQLDQPPFGRPGGQSGLAAPPLRGQRTASDSLPPAAQRWPRGARVRARLQVVIRQPRSGTRILQRENTCKSTITFHLICQNSDWVRGCVCSL